MWEHMDMIPPFQHTFIHTHIARSIQRANSQMRSQSGGFGDWDAGGGRKKACVVEFLAGFVNADGLLSSLFRFSLCCWELEAVATAALLTGTNLHDGVHRILLCCCRAAST